MTTKPHLAVTLGDPAGIGPEVVLKALTDFTDQSLAHLTLVGERSLWQATYQRLQALGKPAANPDDFEQIQVNCPEGIQIGQGNAASGAASFACLITAIQATLQGQFQGIVTAPIAKAAWQLAGHRFPGQTEVLAQYAGVNQYGMLFVARSPVTGWTLRTLLATTHIPLAQVPRTLTPELMTRKLDLLLTSLKQDFGLEYPAIAIPGLNPHSGEQGQLGTEEQDWLIPWLAEAQRQYPQVKLIGPVPPDTLWVNAGQAWYHSPPPNLPDAYLALYHDQGLIPVKLLGFDQAINTTIGLPFIRTSPDHGTAFDIAGQGIAKAESFKAALDLAIALAQHR